MKRIAVLLLCCLLVAGQARAQTPPAGGLTEGAIRQFYQAGADAYKLPYDKYSSFLQSALADGFQVTSNNTINMPGQPPRQATTTQGRDDALAQTRQLYDAMRNATLAVSVDKIQIAPSGLSAIVHTTTSAHGLSFPAKSHVTADTAQSCDDQIVLTPNGQIQILKSQCDTTMTMQTGEAAGLGQ